MLDAEDQGSEGRNQKKIDFSTIISTKQASKIAINHIGKGKATNWKLDKNLSTTYWEVTVKKIGKTSKVSIDAISGKVLAVEGDD
ncbi:PepSY domain-containing protein [Enterococcus raffinosus]|uniref:PepSY domain-containing protein n=1 Tax=Enterococcus raffinosus TaxID=71452 RepID=A0AAW8TBJ7_9ENTE|nr:PepSY domain-containing protein [Enterococcus raffinosus]MDT2525838.1 PepSY domain-containing protein [Enterococcus raffinosus]MDT2531278.1 PepSY domain-containing protein [Enterococcus raffinosus]MDT2536369.1 PepSY domain-containing protein [Enterococcus raffinosus]MDT2545959.1 PepSY domain-containing protein [Enterococcus raffinosus]MDT2556009.1 PepSY domain-containing protein [Enterococcus raffinosus]